MRYDFREKAVEGGLAALALLSLAVLAGIVFYLFREGLPVFASTGFLDFVFGTDWYPVGDQPDFEIGSLIAGSLAVTFLASLFAVPLGLMTAAYLSEVAANTTRPHGERRADHRHSQAQGGGDGPRIAADRHRITPDARI